MQKQRGKRAPKTGAGYKDIVVMFGSLRAAQPASFMIGGSRVVEPAWLFWGPFLAVGLGIYFVVHEFRAYRRRRLLGY